MPQQIAETLQNTFRQGLVTEATGLNFPENACTETYNCVFDLDGSVSRRLGFDFENNYDTTTINREDVVVTRYLWQNVSGDGNTTFLVLQVGATLYFFDTTGSSVSSGNIGSSIDLNSFLATGAANPELQECQFSSSNKYLIVTHPACDPFYVSYNAGTSSVSGTAITIKIRDFEGDPDDSLDITSRPTATLSGLDIHHKYNLYNQGWTTTNLTAWDTSESSMPSNADIMWEFKNSSDEFDTSTIPNVINGNTPAPNGHYILTLWDQDRDTASGLSGVTSNDAFSARPSTCAFFAGRAFYAGINQLGYAPNIYFTQIIQRDSQYGACYQTQDPTSEDLHDLLPSDGGVIAIQEAGTIYKLVSISGALIVFANNGIWSITGSTGLGFSATDYSVQKLSSISALSATSFVDVGGVPAWWNSDGIYILTPSNNGISSPSIKNLTISSVKSLYDSIPVSSKTTATGFYNTVTGVIQWLYRSTEGSGPTENYSYDRVLNYNINTGAFYPWKIPTSDIAVNGVLVLSDTHGYTTQATIEDDSGNTIVDDDGKTIIAFDLISSGQGSQPTFKYIVSYPSGSSYLFTCAESINGDYLDWESYDNTGTDFESYFISGYQVHGKGMTKFQPKYITLFSRTTSSVQFHFQPVWDYAVTGSGTGRWGSKQYVTHTNLSYGYAMRRLKVRGMGRALQFKVSSVTGQKFDLVGWAGWETGNAIP